MHEVYHSKKKFFNWSQIGAIKFYLKIYNNARMRPDSIS